MKYPIRIYVMIIFLMFIRENKAYGIITYGQDLGGGIKNQ